MAESAIPLESIAYQLGAIVGGAHVITDEAERKVYSNDIFFGTTRRLNRSNLGL